MGNQSRRGDFMEGFNMKPSTIFKIMVQMKLEDILKETNSIELEKSIVSPEEEDYYADLVD